VTKQQAWERFAEDGHELTVAVRPNRHSEALYRARVMRRVNVDRRWMPICGQGPTPEAAIAAALGETLEDDAK